MFRRMYNRRDHRSGPDPPIIHPGVEPKNMLQTTDDIRIANLRPLLPPAILTEEAPLTETASETVSEARKDAVRILTGEDDRLLVIVGPCSIHDIGAALEYAKRLLAEVPKHEDALKVIMRVYFEKPRTTVGWKGLINDPHLDNSFDINQGVRKARGLLLELAEQGIAAGTEFLDTITPQYIADVVAWGAIGARTTESQIHRELASGLSMPIGFKNGTDGSVQIAIDAIGAARNPHHFLSVTKQGIAAIVETRGNPDCHVILRGSNAGPNYDAEQVEAYCQKLEASGLHPALMIDCSHGNSGKDHTRQPLVVQEVATQIAGGSRRISGVMLESHLGAGNQALVAGETPAYGVSITDKCMDWETSAEQLHVLAEAVRKRRQS